MGRDAGVVGGDEEVGHAGLAKVENENLAFA